MDHFDPPLLLICSSVDEPRQKTRGFPGKKGLLILNNPFSNLMLPQRLLRQLHPHLAQTLNRSVVVLVHFGHVRYQFGHTLEGGRQFGLELRLCQDPTFELGGISLCWLCDDSNLFS